MYYNNSYSSKEPSRRKSFSKILLSSLLTIAALIAGTLLLLTLMTPMTESKNWVFPMLGILAPFTYLVSLIIFLILVIRWQWKMAIFMLLLLLAGLGEVPKFIKFSASKKYEIKDSKHNLKLMSYNLKLADGDSSDKVKDIFEYVKNWDCGIIAFQEADQKNNDLKEIFSDYEQRSSTGLCLLSRYKIIDDEIIFGSEQESHGVAQQVDILFGKDTIRIINVHLLSTSITPEDNEFLLSPQIYENGGGDKFLDMARRLAKTSYERREQGDKLAEAIASSPYPIIVCGDFNDTPQSYTYKKVSQGMNDAFVESGSGYSHTFRGFMSILRIDYVFSSPELIPIYYEVDEKAEFSDHLPLIVDLKLDKTNFESI